MKSTASPKKPTHPLKEIQYDMEGQIENIEGTIQALT
jgi:predicted DNA-binding transcriptional regulator